MDTDLQRKKNGLPIVGKADLNDLAIKILLEYDPEVIEKPMALDIQSLAEDKLCLEVKNGPMYFDCILGYIVYTDMKIPIDEINYMSCKEGTIVINKDIANIPSRCRFTIAYGLSHWILHREYCNYAGYPCDYRMSGGSYITGKDDLRELGRKNPIVCQNDDAWCEWQADNLGAALLMPAPPFIKAAKEIMEYYNFSQYQLISGERINEGKKVVAELAEIYKVSHRSIRIRLRSLGMYLGES